MREEGSLQSIVGSHLFMVNMSSTICIHVYLSSYILTFTGIYWDFKFFRRCAMVKDFELRLSTSRLKLENVLETKDHLKIKQLISPTGTGTFLKSFIKPSIFTN